MGRMTLIATLAIWAMGGMAWALDPAIIQMYDPKNLARLQAQPVQQASGNAGNGRVCTDCNSGGGGCERGLRRLFPKPWGGHCNDGLHGCYAHHNDFGCGSFVSDSVFIFGSCRAFFNQACNKRPGPTPWELLYGPHMNTAPGVLPPGTYINSPPYPTPRVDLPSTPN